MTESTVSAEREKLAAWLEAQIDATESNSEAHPEGSGNRAFYKGQMVAYENAFSFLDNMPVSLAASSPARGINDGASPAGSDELVEKACRAFVGPAWDVGGSLPHSDYRNRMRDVLAVLAPASDPPAPAQAPGKAGDREVLGDVKAVAGDLAQACIEAGDNKGAGAFQFISGFISDRLAALSPAPTGTEAPTPHQSDSGEVDAASWLWSELMRWCRARGYAPANYSDLFEIVSRLRAALAARPTPAQPRAEG